MIGPFQVKLTEENLEEIYGAVLIEEVAGSRSLQNMDHLQWKFAKTLPKT